MDLAPDAHGEAIESRTRRASAPVGTDVQRLVPHDENEPRTCVGVAGWSGADHYPPGSSALLARYLENLRRVSGQVQALQELLLGQHLVRLHLLEGARLDHSCVQRTSADRVGKIHEGHYILSPELPVDTIKAAAEGFHHPPQRLGPVAMTGDHACPGA